MRGISVEALLALQTWGPTFDALNPGKKISVLMFHSFNTSAEKVDKRSPDAQQTASLAIL